ncbi:uncharacterized protein F5891DRAFT_598912 [Suillus fuscotomentosus]|uniref:Uncharacterized protein n=1 Tax=Suillus fuscotomentosus TaxID=1912939 RepID=A0AAD4DZ65_9AGAM|nr:uncharacterized protein F5891DRAFT_598912 [Suillus fuscotomentosus]KAG1896342.1 hypothetical protein F5891DRAFT_598912 [Suillus fuscotomentosus]
MIPKRKPKHNSLLRRAARAASFIFSLRLAYAGQIHSTLRRADISTAAWCFSAKSSFGATLCTDRHRYCQSNNNGEEGETHFLCEVIWNLLEGISNDISENAGPLGDSDQLLYSLYAYGHNSDRFGRIVLAVKWQNF